MESTKPSNKVFTYIDIDAIDNKKNVIANAKQLQSSHAPSRAIRKLHSGDILFSMVRPYLKNIAIVTDEYSSAIASSGFYVITPVVGVYPQYLYYLMLSPYVVDGLNSFLKGDNSPSINNRHIDNYLFPLPPFMEQQRIALAIRQWWMIIDSLEQCQNDVKDVVIKAKRKILDLAIHGKLVTQDPTDEPAIELLRRINPNFSPCDIGHSQKLPMGWIRCDFNDIFTTISSQAYQILQSQIQQKGLYPVISQSSNFIEGFSNQECVFIHSKPCVVFGDHTRNVTYVDFNFIVGADGVKILIPKVNERWAYYTILYASLHIQNKGYQRHYNQIVNWPYFLPPFVEQCRIVKKIDDMFYVLENIQKSLEA